MAPADAELSRRTNSEKVGDNDWSSLHTSVETDYGRVEILIDEGTASLARALARATTPAAADEALREGDARINHWWASRETNGAQQRVDLNIGMRLLFPEEAIRRRG